VDCRKVRCIGGSMIVAAIDVPSAKLGLAKSVVSGWLKVPRPKHSACMMEEHHALSFSHGGHRYVMLLCYTCGQYMLLVDGKMSGYGDRWDPPGLAVLNGLLADGGAAGYVPPARN
jgi:hypothetical protein